MTYTNFEIYILQNTGIKWNCLLKTFFTEMGFIVTSSMGNCTRNKVWQQRKKDISPLHCTGTLMELLPLNQRTSLYGLYKVLWLNCQRICGTHTRISSYLAFGMVKKTPTCQCWIASWIHIGEYHWRLRSSSRQYWSWDCLFVDICVCQCQYAITLDVNL